MKIQSGRINLNIYSNDVNNNFNNNNMGTEGNKDCTIPADFDDIFNQIHSVERFFNET